MITTGSNIIDSFFVALGFQVDTSGLDEMAHKSATAKTSMLSWANALKVALGGAVLKGIAHVNSALEQNRIAIGGMLNALGVDQGFQAGLQDADDIIQQITRDAAKLPGTAEDYIEVFKRGLPFVQEAMGKGATARDIANFTNRLSAIFVPELGAGVVGGELDMILAKEGRASKRLPLFMRLSTIMSTLPGQANLTAQSFNAMSQHARFELMVKALAKMQPMLDAQTETWEAVAGAVESTLKMLVRLGSSSLFAGMKQGLQAINDFFYKDSGELTLKGQLFVFYMRQLGDILVKIGHDGLVLVKWFIDVQESSRLANVALAAFVVGVMGLEKALRFGMIGVFALAIDDLIKFAEGGNSVTGLIVNKWHPALYLIIGAVGLLGAKIFGLMPLLNTTGMIIGTLAGKFGILIGQIVATTVRLGLMAAAWIAANLPIVATVAALALVGVALYELYTHWDQVIAKMKELWAGFVETIKSAPHDIKVALGFGSDSDTAALAQKQAAYGRGDASYSGAGGDVIWRNPITGLEETHAPGWTPPAAGGGVDQSRTTSTTITSHVGTVNIVTNDPAKMAEEYQRKVIRNGQGSLHL